MAIDSVEPLMDAMDPAAILLGAVSPSGGAAGGSFFQGMDGMGDQMDAMEQGETPTASSAVRSLSYHKFLDPDTDADKVLNRDKRVVREIQETAYGIAWTVPNDWTGATVLVFAVREYSDPPELAGVTGTGFVDPDDGKTICYDFIGGPQWPEGDWIFHAKLTLGEYIDVTSGIAVTDQADLI
ncbi:MAG: hypothetical protein ABIY70_09085 [Capsulimonas sp.]|uniref:hypothetical protein n=1 Tax=Capsulimonas sp. TaxID=2494211 RepID=UPI003264CD18